MYKQSLETFELNGQLEDFAGVREEDVRVCIEGSKAGWKDQTAPKTRQEEVSVKT